MTDRECDDIVLYVLRAAGKPISFDQLYQLVALFDVTEGKALDSAWRLIDDCHADFNPARHLFVTPDAPVTPRPNFLNPMRFVYTNHRGETALRTVAPIRLYHGATEYHPEPQWLLEAIDLDKDALRTFAMRDMKEIR